MPEAWDQDTPGLVGAEEDPPSPSTRRALPRLAPPLDRGVQPVMAMGIVISIIVLWWLRRRFAGRRG